MTNIVRKLKISEISPVNFTDEELDIIKIIKYNFTDTIANKYNNSIWYLKEDKVIFEHDLDYDGRIFIRHNDIIMYLEKYIIPDTYLLIDNIKDLIFYYIKNDSIKSIGVYRNFGVNKDIELRYELNKKT